ncbi:MAG TPA: SDR family NAD(P)-dependent oxidoreductase [Nostoc sp.]|uniref:SDR family NAD(P)-dependent oxidoreductase n=1 Tax=Nostoc sp. TaxID=1180 RepID=UPI002D4491E1|nr:SDR family NAD(P)-dependent oxidoreductase [Nostoc sp.]HYX15623.1 SDR family NAD(P)-dependent oxidoreductase [Nostoc sp.]
MRELSGTTAIITGASRGIGVEIAKSLAERKVRIVLAARSAEALEAVRHDITKEQTQAQILTIPTDITDPNAQAHLVEQTLSKFGTIDLLINNAGVVMLSTSEQSMLRNIEQTIAVNLTAAMTLTQRVLSVMLEQNRGHIVNVASLSGLFGVGGGESYSATKHGLVGFTRSLRLSLKVRKSSVSASVICPGFVKEVGMYADRLSSGGNRAPFILGTTSVYAVSCAIIRAIEHDLPEVVVSPRPIRLLLALTALSPRIGEWVLRQAGAHHVFEVGEYEQVPQ